MKTIDDSKTLQQLVPLALTLIILGVLIAILYLFVFVLDLLPFGEKIILITRPVDILVGLTIYLKTAIDFAIFMGRLMASSPGWRNRIAIEIGSALGNALGTLLIIALWVVFKEIDWLLALMVFIASLVLLELAYGGLEHLGDWERQAGLKKILFNLLQNFLQAVLLLAQPILKRIIPDLRSLLKGKAGLSWRALFTFSMSVPFILGLDDFAGYVPLFNVINVFGFAIGVFLGHTLLNIALFISPSRTIVAVKNEYVSFVGTIAFIGLAFYGFFEVYRIFTHLF